MSEKITGNKQQDLASLKAYYETLRASKAEKQKHPYHWMYRSGWIQHVECPGIPFQES